MTITLPSADEVSASLTLAQADYRTARDRLAELTLIHIVADLAEDAPNARWMSCDYSDQSFDGMLCFASVSEDTLVEIDLEDEGDRYFDRISLGDLYDGNKHVWEPYCAPEVPDGMTKVPRVLDLQQIREAIADGTLAP